MPELWPGTLPVGKNGTLQAYGISPVPMVIEDALLPGGRSTSGYGELVWLWGGQKAPGLGALAELVPGTNLYFTGGRGDGTLNTDAQGLYFGGGRGDGTLGTGAQSLLAGLGACTDRYAGGPSRPAGVGAWPSPMEDQQALTDWKSRIAAGVPGMAGCAERVGGGPSCPAGLGDIGKAISDVPWYVWVLMGLGLLKVVK